MTDYTNLLRMLKTYEDGYGLYLDAAAAIESLIGTIGDLQAIRERLEEENYALRLEPKRGEWIIHGEPPMLVIECSVCGQKYFNHVMQEKAKYCSMCGAKMGGTE